METLRKVTRKSVLLECLEIFREQRRICSTNYNGLEPKKGMEDKWNETRDKIQILEELIQSYESEPVRKAIANWQKEVMEQGPCALQLDGKRGQPEAVFYEG